MKRRMCIEDVVSWAATEELPRGRAVSADPWQAIMRYGALGTRVDVSRRHVDPLGYVPGEPHADAIAVARAVAALPRLAATEDEIIDMLGHWAWCEDARPSVPATLASQSFDVAALVRRCAALGPMPWDVGTPRLRAVRYANQHALVVDRDGRCLRADKRGHYPLAAEPRCLVQWGEPAIIELAEARLEYALWWRALAHLAVFFGRAPLATIDVLPPRVARRPWDTGETAAPKPLASMIAPPTMDKLPLQPNRPRALAPLKSAIEEISAANRRRPRPMSIDEETTRP